MTKAKVDEEEVYWLPSKMPRKAILKWVNDNVVEALRLSWTEALCCIDFKKDMPVELTVFGPGKPTEEDPEGKLDIHTASFDILGELKFFCENEYPADGPKLNKALREEAEEWRDSLRKLADGIGLIIKNLQSAIDKQ